MADQESPEFQKVRYIEDRASLLIESRFHRFEELSKETHSTLNWLLGIMIGSIGYGLKQIKDGQWWILPALLAAAFLSAYHARRLIHLAMMAGPVPPIGTDPKAFKAEDLDEIEMRRQVTEQIGEHSENLLETNKRKGAAINYARQGIVNIGFTVILLCVISLLLMLVSRRPCEFDPLSGMFGPP